MAVRHAGTAHGIGHQTNPICAFHFVNQLQKLFGQMAAVSDHFNKQIIQQISCLYGAADPKRINAPDMPE